MKKNLKTSLEYPGDAFVDRDLLQSLINNTDDLTWSVDRNYNVLISNQPYDNTLGQLFKKNSTGKDALANQLHFLSLYERAFSGETFTEIEYTQSPVEKWLEISYHPIHNGNEITGVSCYAHDVSALKSEITYLKLLESVVTNATDAILITEACPLALVPKIVYVNNALLKMTGYTLDEVIGKTPNLLLGAKSDKKQLEHLRTCFENSECCEIEIINYKKNGGEFWVHMAMVPVADTNGLFTHFIGIGRDVTERVKNIEAIKEQNTKLCEIARVQSHDVRGPLARIKGLVDLLSNYSGSTDDSGTKELLNLLKDSANELDAVIKKITQLSDE